MIPQIIGTPLRIDLLIIHPKIKSDIHENQISFLISYMLEVIFTANTAIVFYSLKTSYTQQVGAKDRYGILPNVFS